MQLHVKARSGPARGRDDGIRPSDADLLERLVAGDEEALVSLYRRWQQACTASPWGMTGSPPTADDVVQETFVILMREGTIRLEPRRRGLLPAGIARHLVHRRGRRESRFA
jgi:DNA-directed RNA polymerase specialized sigma24 family protein